MIEEIKCPRCGDENPKFNALRNDIPIEEQLLFVFICSNPDCRFQFDPSEEHGLDDEDFKS